MRRVTRPTFASASGGTTVYNQFQGCHFLTDETLCEDNYSPDCLNMFPDASGFPEKRPGWRTYFDTGDAEATIKSVHFMYEKESKHEYMIVNTGKKVTTYDRIPDGYEQVMTFDYPEGTTSKYGFYAVPYGGEQYLFDGVAYRRWNGTRTVRVADISFEPTTSILRKPTGGGETYQAVNLLSPFRHNTFITDGVSTSFLLDGIPDEGAHITVMDLEINKFYEVSSVDYSTGMVTLTTAPPAPAAAGTQKIDIRYKRTVDGYADMIGHCVFATLYGYDAQNRVFASGNKDFPNRIFYSELNDPTYFPDTNYIDIGVANFPITGFSKTLAGELAVLKESGGMEATIWHVSAEIDSDGDTPGTYFPVREGITGTGAVNHLCQQSIKNDVLFLNEHGVFDLKTSYSSSRYISNVVLRSKYVNYKLLHDSGLSGAFSVAWNHNYMLFLGDHVYVMTEDRQWYYWDNIPATCATVWNDTVFFGTADGRICRFNTDLVTDDGNLLMLAYNDDGEPITARWTTKINGDGDIFQPKQLERTGAGVYLKTYPRTSVRVVMRLLNAYGRVVSNASVSRFDFDDIDFNAVNFTTNPTYDCRIRTRIRSYKAMQVVLENDKLNEGFGVSLVQYAYLYMAKR